MRDLFWSGGYNIRELGGLPTTDGRETAQGAIVRSATLDRLTDEGWAALSAYGIRTIIDLRNDGESAAPTAARPDGVALVRVPIDEIAGGDWYLSVRHLDGTPRIFAHYLSERPQSVAALIKAVAAARPGGIVIHCAGGRDRTGLSSLVLLALAQVEPEAIAADYELSYERQRAAWAALGMSSMLDNLLLIDEELAKAGTTAREAVLATLAGFDPVSLLTAAGVTEAELTAAMARLRPA